MGITIIVGGQLGDEGKGKATKFFTEQKGISIAVRCGGSNSDHSVDGKIFRTLPSSCELDGVISVLPAGSYIDLDILKEEIEKTNLNESKLKIDENAVIITNEVFLKEKYSGLGETIASTLSGTGYAHQLRSGRNKKEMPTFVKDEPYLKNFICNTKHFLRESLDYSKKIIIEGTQGYGLSVLHSKYYPYVTCRDTTAAGFLSETGLSPLDVEDIIMCIRTFPIRVNGNSGPMKDEFSWSDRNIPPEFTEKTGLEKRIGQFDFDMVKEAIIVNQPSLIVLNHLDYVDETIRNNKIVNSHSRAFILDIERNLGRKIDYFGVNEYDIILRKYIGL